MRLLFLAIQQYLLSALSAQGVTYARMFNNQVERLKNGELTADFALMTDTGDSPILLIEFVSPAVIEQLGNGDQLYNPFDIRVHIVHQFYDAQDGTQDQNLKVLDVAEAVYDAFQEWMPSTTPVGVMTRISEEWDYDHPNIYHFVQVYRTTFVDNKKDRPENGKLSDPAASFELVRINSVETSNQYYYN